MYILTAERSNDIKQKHKYNFYIENCISIKSML